MKTNENNMVVIDDIYRVYRKSYNGHDAYAFTFWSFMNFNHGLITLTIPQETLGADEVCNEMGSKFQRRPLEIVFTSDDYNNCEVVSVKLVECNNAETRDAKGEHFLYKVSRRKGFNGKEEDDEVIEKRIEKENEAKKKEAMKKEAESKKENVVRKEDDVKVKTKMNYNNNNNNEQLVIGKFSQIYGSACTYTLELKFNDDNCKKIYIDSATPGVEEFLEECRKNTVHHRGRVAWKCSGPLGTLLHGRLVGVLGEVYCNKEGQFGMNPSYVGLISEYDSEYNKIIPPEMPGPKRRMPKCLL